MDVADYRIAVLSDLHCHPKSHGRRASYLLCGMMRTPVEKHPIGSLLKLIRDEQLTADALVAAGDFTDMISEEGFEVAWSSVEEVGRELEVEVIVPTIGNHDVDSRGVTDYADPFHIARSVHHNFLFPDDDKDDEFWLHGVSSVRTAGVGFIVVNSVARHYNENEAERGGISERQLERVQEIGGKWSDISIVAVCHHHPIQHNDLEAVEIDVMANGSRLVECLSELSSSLLVHGHRHYPRLRYGHGGSVSVPVFAAGSLTAFSPKMASTTGNTFHMVSLKEESVEDCIRPGEVESWEYNLTHGWRIAHRRSIDFPPVTGFGFRGSVSELADRIDALLEESSASTCPWERVVSEVPQVRYMVPADFDRFVRVLEEEHDAKLYYEEGEPVPSMVGRVIRDE